MTAEMETKIEGIDPHSTTSSLFLPSVHQVPRGDGLCLPKEWINGRQRAGGVVGGLWLHLGPSQVVFSSGQNGGNRCGIDKVPGEDKVPMPCLDRRAD